MIKSIMWWLLYWAWDYWFMGVVAIILVKLFYYYHGQSNRRLCEGFYWKGYCDVNNKIREDLLAILDSDIMDDEKVRKITVYAKVLQERSEFVTRFRAMLAEIERLLD